MSLSQALKNEFESRCQKNPQYSLRAYAKWLNIDAPTLSKILNEKKNVGQRLAERLMSRLELPPAEAKQILSVYKKLKDITHKTDKNFVQLQDDQFRLVSHWYYWPILLTLEMNDFKDDLEWVAQKVSLPLKTVQIAVDRLERLGLLQKENGQWKKKLSPFTTVLGNEVSTNARRTHQKELLQKAIEAIDNTPPEQRDQTSLTIPCDISQIEEAKTLITEFRRKMASFFDQAPKKEQVYNLTISLYPVTDLRSQK